MINQFLIPMIIYRSSTRLHYVFGVLSTFALHIALLSHRAITVFTDVKNKEQIKLRFSILLS